MKLYAATSNAGKLRDFAQVRADGFEVHPLPGLADMPEPVEDAATFEGNALIKALAYAKRAPGLIVLADDSGIEVDALGGLPGVRSARFADDEGFAGAEGESRDERNLACLIDRAQDLAGDTRAARYRCVLVAVRDGEVLASGSGAVEGVLALAPRGTGGFGYDPIFVPDGCLETMGELSPEARFGLSHRARAMGELLLRLAGTRT